MTEDKNKFPEEEAITDSGSSIAQVGEEHRGRRGLNRVNTPEEEAITDSGSSIAQVDDEHRGRRGLNRGNIPEEEAITDSGSSIAQVGDELRGRRGLNRANTPEEEAITDSGSSIARVGDEHRGRRGFENQRQTERSTYTASKSENEYFSRGNDELLDIVIIRGKQYKIVRVISDSTAEARILQIERDNMTYALKLYYPHKGHRVNKEVLQLIMDKEQPGIIKIYDFGEMVNGFNPDEQRDFELMEFCEGGVLKPRSLHGKEEELYYVTLGMVMSATSCNLLGFIHRDIKPENFLWANKEHTRLVLSDFGFAVPCPTDEYIRVEDHRTIIYTAPEFYLRAPGMPPRISAASDLYSVGISMLTLWSGEEVMMGMTETEQIEMKSREKLPYPSDMPQSLKELLCGLTTARPDQRWDFDKIKNWMSEDPDKNIQEQLNTEFEIIFDPSNNLVAYNRMELANLMMEYPQTGIRLLYSGMIEYWIEEAGFFEEAVQLHDITENLYPTKEQHEAGLWFTIYYLAPETPYFFPEGPGIPSEDLITYNEVELFEKVWEHVFVSKNQYLKDYIINEINNPSRLTAYLTVKGHEEIIGRVRKYTKEFSRAEEGLLLLIYNITSGLPLYLNGRFAESIGEINDAVYHNGGKPFDILLSDAFIEWLEHRDPFFADKIKDVIKNSGAGSMVVSELIDFSLEWGDDALKY